MLNAARRGYCLFYTHRSLDHRDAMRPAPRGGEGARGFVVSGSGARAEQDGDQPLEEARRQEAFILGGQRTASRGALVIHPLMRSLREPRGCDDYGQISILTRLVGAKLS